MHEMSLITSMLTEITDTLQSGYGSYRVKEIRLKAGRLSNAVPEALQSAFRAAARGTAFEDAVLAIENIPLRCLCTGCKTETESDSLFWACPKCGSEKIRITGGRELFIDSVDIEETGASP